MAPTCVQTRVDPLLKNRTSAAKHDSYNNKMWWVGGQKKSVCLFSTVMTSPGPAVQECTGSCHENVPAPKVVSSDLPSTDGLTVLAWIEHELLPAVVCG